MTFQPSALVLCSALLSGCALTPTDSAQTPDVPTAWKYPRQRQLPPAEAAQTVVSTQWWSEFGSAELDAVVATAHAQSVDIATSVARVQQARAQARIAGSALLPEVSASTRVNRDGRISGRSGQSDAAGTHYALGVNTSYEIDFWGKNAAIRDAALADVHAAAFDRDALRLTVTAAAASQWLLAVGLRERLAIAHLNLNTAQQVLQTIVTRERAGVATALDLAQQRSLVAAQARQLAALRQQADNAQITLAVLLGIAPSDPRATVRANSLTTLTAPSIAEGLPANLLTRRPDISRAEARLTAAEANVLAARAAMLPSLTLTAALGTNAAHLSTLVDHPIYSVAAGLAAPIFNAGKLAAGRDFARAQQDALIAEYRGTIVAALGDVETALTTQTGTDAQRQAQGEELKQAELAYQLAQTRYRAGAESMLTLLDAQRTLYGSQDAAVALHQEYLQAHVALFKALGGGWSLP